MQNTDKLSRVRFKLGASRNPCLVFLLQHTLPKLLIFLWLIAKYFYIEFNFPMIPCWWIIYWACPALHRHYTPEQDNSPSVQQTPDSSLQNVVLSPPSSPPVSSSRPGSHSNTSNMCKHCDSGLIVVLSIVLGINQLSIQWILDSDRKCFIRFWQSSTYSECHVSVLLCSIPLFISNEFNYCSSQSESRNAVSSHNNTAYPTKPVHLKLTDLHCPSLWK